MEVRCCVDPNSIQPGCTSGKNQWIEISGIGSIRAPKAQSKIFKIRNIKFSKKVDELQRRAKPVRKKGEPVPTVGVGNGSLNQCKMTGEELVQGERIVLILIVGTRKPKVQFEQLFPGSGEILL